MTMTRLESKEDSDATRREEPVVAVVASVVEQVVGILVDRDWTRARGEDEAAKDGWAESAAGRKVRIKKPFVRYRNRGSG